MLVVVFCGEGKGITKKILRAKISKRPVTFSPYKFEAVMLSSLTKILC